MATVSWLLGRWNARRSKFQTVWTFSSISQIHRACASSLWSTAYGNNESLGRPNLTKVLNDAEDVYDSLGVAEALMIVMGRSIGTIPAVHLAGQHPTLSTLILDSGMTNPVRRFQADAPLLAPEIEARLKAHGSNLGNFRGNLLLLHCNDDQVFPGDHALSLFQIGDGEESKEAAKTKRLTRDKDSNAIVYEGFRTKLVLFDAGGHNYIWALNWYLYSQAVLLLLTGKQDDDWWSAAKPSEPKEHSVCAIH